MWKIGAVCTTERVIDNNENTQKNQSLLIAILHYYLEYSIAEHVVHVTSDVAITHAEEQLYMTV